MSRASLQIMLDDCELPGNLRQALTRLDASVAIASLSDRTTWDTCVDVDAVVIVPGSGSDSNNYAVKQLLGRLSHRPMATLLMGEKPKAGWSDVVAPSAISLGKGEMIGPEELAGRLTAMIEMSQTLSQGLFGRLTDELAAARRAQRGLLPSCIPDLAGYRIHVLYRAAGSVSGDIYGFAPCETGQTGFWLADVCGHGLGAGMLTGYVKRCMTAGGTDALVVDQPETLLERLNDDLLREQAESAIVAACWASLESNTGRVVWSRGGLPYPIHVRPGMSAMELQSPGTVLGALESPELVSCETHLKPGESIILHTDGLEWVLTKGQGISHATLSLTGWFRSLGTRSITSQLMELDQLYDLSAVDERDDLSVVVIERLGDSA